MFYLEIPPSLFGMVIKGLADAGLTNGARVVVEKPFGHDSASARALNEQIHEYIDESQLYRIDHFLGKMGTDELLYLRFGNTMLEPIWNRNHIACVEITMAESFGVEDRGHFYDPVGALRDVVVNHLMQVVALAAMEAPAGADAGTLKDAKFAVFRSIEDADPAHYVRGQYEGYRDIEGVSQTRRPRHTRPCVWTSKTGAGRASRCSSAPASAPVTQTELRARLPAPPAPASSCARTPPEPNQFVVKLDPSTGIRLILDAHRADAAGRRVTLDLEFADQGGEAPTPYEVLLLHAMLGDSTRFTRQDQVEEAWRIFQPLLDDPPPVHPYAPGIWGPKEAISCWRDSEPGQSVGVAMSPSKPKARQTGSKPCRRGSATDASAGQDAPAPAQQSAACPRRFRRSPTTRFCPTAITAGWLPPMGDRLALRSRFDAPSVFGRLLDRQAGGFRLGPFGINVPSARIYEPGTNMLLTMWKTPAVG